MAKIEEVRRQPIPQTVVAEKELWRRQAIYLTPRRGETWADAIVPNFVSSSELNRIETIRAWENVLVLDGNDTEAMTYLGVCLIGFNRWSGRSGAAVQCVAGSQLVERALRSRPSQVLADTFIACIGALKEKAPTRAREMAQYVVNHREQFRHADNYWVKSALVAPAPDANRGLDANQASWKRALDNAGKEPDGVLLAFHERLVRKALLDQDAAFLGQYLESPDPVVQFIVHATLGELLCRAKKDPAGLAHFDKAIEVLAKAAARCNPGYSQLLNSVYRLRVEACQLLGRPEEAKQSALKGTRRFMESASFDDSIAWLYHYCVMNVLEAGQETEALAICDAYLAAVEKKDHVGRDFWPGIAAKREELLTRLAQKPVPGLGDLQLLKGTELAASTDGPTPSIRMAATKGKLWLVSSGGGISGRAQLYDYAQDTVSRLPNVPYGVGCIAATTDCVCIGGPTGLYLLDTNGTLRKHYDQKNAAMPADRILDVCEGGGKFYFSFQGSPHQGVAVLDPASGAVSVLAPSRREAKQDAEPLVNVFRVRWDALTSRLFACCYQYWYGPFPMLTNEYSWTPQSKSWQSYPIKEAPRLVVSQGDEAMLVRASGGKSEFEFVGTGQKVTSAVPVAALMGEPAWDQDRIWVPTPSGLHAVERASGNVRWVAYQNGNPFSSLLKAHGRLYVATGRGLYYCHIP